MKVGLYPGSFDPFHKGHLKVVQKALKIFDKVIVVVTLNINKERMIPVEESISIIKKELDHLKNIEVLSNENKLTVEFAKEYNCKFIIRGLRNESDLKYEQEIYDINKNLDEEIETVYFLSNQEERKISSKLLKELEYFKKLKGN